MLMNILSVLFFSVFLLCGYYLSKLLFSGQKLLVLIWFGGVFGLVMLMWLPALFAFVVGFTPAAQLLALGPVLLIGGLSFIKGTKAFEKPEFDRNDKKAAYVLIPLFLVGFYLFLTHTIEPAGDGSLHVGQSTFGDLSLHLGLVTSLSGQGTFPPVYSIFPDTLVGYPFLCDSVSATFLALGASLRFSMLLPSVAAYALVLIGVWNFFNDWLKKGNAAILALLFFFIGGGFGFAYFFDLAKSGHLSLERIFTGFYQTPTNIPSIGLRWVNPIADMLVPQRATLFGWTVLFPCLFLLRRAAFDDGDSRRYFAVLGVLAGSLPLIHTHSFLSLGIVSAVYLFDSLWHIGRQRFKGWVIYAVIVAVLASPQLFAFTFRQAQSFLKFHFNWANDTDSYIWFYIKNLGLIFLFLPAAFIMADNKDKRIYIGALFVFAAAELIQFQPNPYDNNKLLFVWFAFTCGLIAKELCVIEEKLKGLRGLAVLCATVLIPVFISGLLTLGREIVSDYELFGANQVEAAAYINENAEKDATVLTAFNHNNAVASLTGRNIVCGTDTFLYFHGLDTAKRRADVNDMFARPDSSQELFEKYDVDYIYVGSYERQEFDVNESYFSRHFIKAYENEEVTIYSIKR